MYMLSRGGANRQTKMTINTDADEVEAGVLHTSSVVDL